MIQEGLALPFGIQVTNPRSIDPFYGPYISLVEANASVPVALRTVENGTAIMGRTVGIKDGTPKEYWWKNGVTDADLIEKTASGNVSAFTITGDGSTSIFPLTHDLATVDIMVQVRDLGDGSRSVFVVDKPNGINGLEIEFDAPPATGALYRVLVSK